MWFLTAGPVVSVPMILAEFGLCKHCGRSFSVTICILAAESTTNSLSSGSLAEALGRTHFSAGEKCVALSFALRFVIMFGKVPSLGFGHIARVFQSLRGTDPRIFIAWGLRWCRRLTSICPSDGPFLSRILAWRSEEFVIRTLWISFKTFCIKFLRNSFVPWESSASESCGIQPNWGTVFATATALVAAFSSFLGTVVLLLLFIWLFINLVMKKQTRASDLQPVFVL